jgi:predicted dehydrogenase
MDMPLRALIVGGGSIGERHLRCFQQQPEVSVALCEPDDARRAIVTSSYAVRDSFASLEAAAEYAWDAAVICTPANLHVEQSLVLLRCASALLIEKPLSVSAVDTKSLLDAASSKTVAVAYTYRSHPAVRAVRAWIEGGKLGRLCELTVIAGSHFPSFRPAYRDTYYASRELGGGAIQDAATHLFDLAHHLVGRFDWVFCDAAHLVLPGVDVEDTVHVTARANSEQVMVSIAVNQFMAPFEVSLQLNGDRGSACLDLHNHRFGFFPLGATEWQWHETPIRERDDLFREQASLFLDAAAGRRPVTCSLDDARHSLDINIAALQSASIRKMIDVGQT